MKKCIGWCELKLVTGFVPYLMLHQLVTLGYDNKVCTCTEPFLEGWHIFCFVEIAAHGRLTYQNDCFCSAYG